MRMDTLKCLNEDELSLLLYVVNHIDPMTAPKMEIGIKELPWLHQERLIQKLSAQEPKLNAQGKETLRSLIAKLTRYSQHEAEEFQQQENERTKERESNQSVFQF